MEVSLFNVAVFAAILLIVVGWFVYKLVTDRSISDEDPDVMTLFHDIKAMNRSEQERIRTAINSGVFDDDSSE